MNSEQINKIIKIANIENIFFNENLKNYMGYKTEKFAKVLVKPTNIKQLIRLVKYLKKQNVDFYILGNGTNTLACKNLELVICLKKIIGIRIKNNKIFGNAGESLFNIINKSSDYNLKGLEKLYGIPASLGGAIVQNCGAFGCCISDRLIYVKVFDGKKTRVIKKEDLEFSYRDSVFKRKNDLIILSACFELLQGDKLTIKKEMDETLKYRKSKQPYDYPSCGSVFKRCEDAIASQLIDEAGLKGYQIGGAKVSEKHAGFIINYDNATSEDILNLIDFIKNTIKLQKNIDLECEIVLLY